MIPKVFAQTFVGIFFAILFLQSGLDKVFNWKGNREWIVGHFRKSFLAPVTVPMLVVLTLTEVAAGFLCIAGVALYWNSGLTDLLIVGLEVSALALVMLFFGQRLVQDYPGAQSIAIYFGLILIALMYF